MASDLHDQGQVRARPRAAQVPARDLRERADGIAHVRAVEITACTDLLN